MDDTGALFAIGAFARRVGLTPSALRFYDDCGVLRPAEVDAVTGYRYYAAEQEPRAVLVRRLREAGVPLVDAAVVLDGPAERARDVLHAHLRRTRESAATTQSAIETVLRELSGDGAPGTLVRLGGAELARAVRQVTPAAATGAAREGFPVLGHVLLDAGYDEVCLVATDRYRLAVRALRPVSFEGEPVRLLLDADRLRQMAAWALPLTEVVVGTDGRTVRFGGAGEERELRAGEGEFPDYRLVLDATAPPRHRVVADRRALCEALVGAGRVPGAPVTLRAGASGLVVAGAPGTPAIDVAAVRTGPVPSVAFDPRVLLPALEASVGPDVLLEVSTADQPVVVRSADQGGFTTLVMPVRPAPVGGPGGSAPTA